MKNQSLIALLSGVALGAAAVIFYNSDKGKKMRKKVKKAAKAEKQKLVDMIENLREEVLPEAERKVRSVFPVADKTLKTAEVKVKEAGKAKK